MDPRLTRALIAYAVLGIAACFLLSGKVLLTVGIILTAFALKTVLWHFRPKE